MSKIGIGVITCNRPEMVARCLSNLKPDEIVVVNDGRPLAETLKQPLIQHDHNLGVGKSKNEAFRYLLLKGCDHIFIIEDDVVVKDEIVFSKYIEASITTNIKHFCAGRFDASELGRSPKNLAQIPVYHFDGVCFNRSLFAAFCYYARDFLESVGLMNESYFNQHEHVDHLLEGVEKGFLPGSLAPDIPLSDTYLLYRGLISTIDYSSARKFNDKIFKSKFGFLPYAIQGIPSHVFLKRAMMIKKFGNWRTLMI